jgi:hypothetical protein
MAIIPLGIFTEAESTPVSEKPFSLLTIISPSVSTELDHLRGCEELLASPDHQYCYCGIGPHKATSIELGLRTGHTVSVAWGNPALFSCSRAR